MNSNERLALIERVEHASGDEAKRALRSMILKCTVTQSTIARAIKDAVERHTPTPAIVYERSEPESHGDVALASSSRNSINKTKDKSDIGRGHESGGASRRHAEAAKSSKTKMKDKRGGTDHRDSRKNNLDDSKKSTNHKKVKHTPISGAEPEHKSPRKSMKGPSDQAKSTVVDLISSSDNEIREEEKLPGRILRNDVPDDNLAIAISSEDEPWYVAEAKKDTADNTTSNKKTSEVGNLGDDSSSTDFWNDESSVDERQGGAVDGVVQPSQQGSNVKTIQAGAGNGDGGPRADSVTISIGEASNQHDSGKLSPFEFSKKRKAPELAMEQVPSQSAKSATDIHVVKKPRQDHPEDQQSSLKDWKCRKCSRLFPSAAQLIEHHKLHQEDATATDGHHRRSKVPVNDCSHQSEPLQRVSNTAGHGFIPKPHDTSQLPSRPRKSAPANRDLLQPSLGFSHNPERPQRGNPFTPTALIGLVAQAGSLSQRVVDRTAPLRPLEGRGPGQQSKPPEPKSLGQRLLRESGEKNVYRCRYCKEPFTHRENWESACSCHPGQYQLLKMSHLVPANFKGGFLPGPYMGWTCCRRKGEQAPSCFVGKHEAIERQRFH